MCQNCSLAVCPSACPARWGGADVSVCEVCSEPIADGEYFSRNGQYVCTSCADELTVSDLLNLCELVDVGELLEELGFKR